MLFPLLSDLNRAHGLTFADDGTAVVECGLDLDGVPPENLFGDPDLSQPASDYIELEDFPSEDTGYEDEYMDAYDLANWEPATDSTTCVTSTRTNEAVMETCAFGVFTPESFQFPEDDIETEDVPRLKIVAKSGEKPVKKSGSNKLGRPYDRRQRQQLARP